MASKKKAVKKYPVVRDPRTGKFVSGSPAAVRKLAKEVARDYRAAVKERNQWAKKRRAGAKLPTTLKRYTKAYRQAAQKVARLEKKVVVAQQMVPTPRAPRLPRVIEIGLNYGAAKGATSDVNINVRISRTDGRGVSENDAKRALFAIASDERDIADDLRITGVEWQRPSKATERRAPTWRSGEPDDVWSFQSIFAHVLFGGKGKAHADYSDFRFGHVKEDEL